MQLPDWRGGLLPDLAAERAELRGTAAPGALGQVVEARPQGPKATGPLRTAHGLHASLHTWSWGGKRARCAEVTSSCPFLTHVCPRGARQPLLPTEGPGQPRSGPCSIFCWPPRPNRGKPGCCSLGPACSWQAQPSLPTLECSLEDRTPSRRQEPGQGRSPPCPRTAKVLLSQFLAKPASPTRERGRGDVGL